MTVHQFLTAVADLIAEGRFVLTLKAGQEAEQEDMDETDVVMVVLELVAGDLYQVIDGGRLWAFVTDVDGEGWYVKLSIDARGCVVISFHPEYD